MKKPRRQNSPTYTELTNILRRANDRITCAQLDLQAKSQELEALQQSKAVRELVIKEQITRAAAQLMEAIARIVSPGTF